MTIKYGSEDGIILNKVEKIVRDGGNVRYYFLLITQYFHMPSSSGYLKLRFLLLKANLFSL